MEGTILFYKSKGRYGFIKEDNKSEGENEIFFHSSGVSEKSYRPKKGQRVTYDAIESNRKVKGRPVMNAVNIKLINLYQ